MDYKFIVIQFFTIYSFFKFCFAFPLHTYSFICFIYTDTKWKAQTTHNNKEKWSEYNEDKKHYYRYRYKSSNIDSFISIPNLAHNCTAIT
jgi:hypothetical protein